MLLDLPYSVSALAPFAYLSPNNAINQRCVGTLLEGVVSLLIVVFWCLLTLVMGWNECLLISQRSGGAAENEESTVDPTMVLSW